MCHVSYEASICIVTGCFCAPRMNRGQKITYEVGQYYILQQVVLSEVSPYFVHWCFICLRHLIPSGFSPVGLLPPDSSYFKKPRNALAYDGRVSTATRNWSGQWMEESWSWELGILEYAGDDVPPR